MHIEDFIAQFNGMCPTPIFREQLEYIQKINTIIQTKQETYLSTLKKDEDGNPVIKPENYMFLKTIYFKQMTNAFFHLGQDLHINPLTLLVPAVFQSDNKIEALASFGSAYDKSLLLNWPYYRQFFNRVRPFKYTASQFMKIVLDKNTPEILAAVMSHSKEFCENYDSMENLLKYKDTGIYFSSKVEYKMSVLTEFITQVLRREDTGTIHASMQVLNAWLTQLPLIMWDICLDALFYVVALLDMERSDIPGLDLTLEVPKAIISQMNDPMRSEEFRKVGREDEHTTQGKISQYNELIDALPIWTILDSVKYKVDEERRQKQIDEVNRIMKEMQKDEIKTQTKDKTTDNVVKQVEQDSD